MSSTKFNDDQSIVAHHFGWTYSFYGIGHFAEISKISSNMLCALCLISVFYQNFLSTLSWSVIPLSVLITWIAYSFSVLLTFIIRRVSIWELLHYEPMFKVSQQSTGMCITNSQECISE